MRILVTGSQGYIGQNIIRFFYKDHTILKYNRENSINELESMIRTAEVIIHTAAKQRLLNGEQPELFEENYRLTKCICESTKSQKIVFLSSIAVYADTPFARVRRREEELIQVSCSNYTVLRLPHTYGPFGRPYYNNFFNTILFCVANKLPLEIAPTSQTFEIIYAPRIANYIDVSIGQSLITKFETKTTTIESFYTHAMRLNNNAEVENEFDLTIRESLKHYTKG